MFKKAFDTVAKFFGKCAASYRQYYELENEKSRKLAQEQEKQNFVNCYHDPYTSVLNQAVHNTATLTNLVVAQGPISFICIDVRVSRNGRYGLIFSGYRDAKCTLSAKEVNRILQKEVFKICQFENWHHIPHLAVQYGDDYEVRIAVGG